MQATLALRRSIPLRRGMVRLAKMALAHDAAFIAVWQFQAFLATMLLLALAALIGTWQAVMVMVPWGLAVTHFYETARRHGLADAMDTPRRNDAGLVVKVLSWLTYVIRMYLLGYKQLIYTRGLGPLIRSPNGGWPRRIAITGGLTLFGVTASHHILRLAGLPAGQIYWWNMLARFLEIPVKVVQTTVVMSFLLFALRLVHLSDPLQVVGIKGWGIG